MPQQPIIDDEGLVMETLDTIAAERANFHRSFDLVHEIIEKFGESGLAERLYTLIPRHRPWEDVADLFGILIWSTSDNGDALIKTTEQWLREAVDLRQVQIALNLDIYPFLERRTMEQVLSDLGNKFPEVA